MARLSPTARARDGSRRRVRASAGRTAARGVALLEPPAGAGGGRPAPRPPVFAAQPWALNERAARRAARKSK